MERIEKTWEQFESQIVSDKLEMKMNESETEYYLWSYDRDGDQLYTRIDIDNVSKSVDQIDFEDNWKEDIQSGAHHTAIKMMFSTADGKPRQQADSRPSGYTTYFPSRFDDSLENVSYPIGTGIRMEWDWSNVSANVTPEQVLPNQSEIPSGYKRYRITGKFCDGVRLKEGTLFYHNVPKKEYINFYIVCPNGYPYYNDNKELTYNTTGDYLVISHYVIDKGMQGSIPMGDELNTEAAVEEDIPSYMEWWFEIDALESDTESNGWVELEMYRKRTRILY